MPIVRISNVEYKRVTELKKMNPRWAEGIVFRGADGKYYQTDQNGFAGGREMYEFNKRLKDEMKKQVGLFDTSEGV